MTETAIRALQDAVAAKKAHLDNLRPLPAEALSNLEHYYDVEITYTSNAIEGNTLSPVETTLVIEKGITISGKPLKDHLEALDHYDAIRYVREPAREDRPLMESDVRNLHRLVMQRSRPEIAGQYADLPRYVRTETGRYDFPPPLEIPMLVGDFSNWLRIAPLTPASAITAHRRVVDIHPFNDGNGRTARLLMNLILIRAGYPPIAVRLEDRPAYIEALQIAQAGQGSEAFDALLLQRLDDTLGDYLNVLRRRSHVRDARWGGDGQRVEATWRSSSPLPFGSLRLNSSPRRFHSTPGRAPRKPAPQMPPSGYIQSGPGRTRHG